VILKKISCKAILGGKISCPSIRWGKNVAEQDVCMDRFDQSQKKLDFDFDLILISSARWFDFQRLV
jgi:hypothetical protein